MAERKNQPGHNKLEKAERALQLITTSKSFSYIEAYKSLRTNLRFMAMGQEQRKIVVTSSIHKEGKSNVAVNLAVTLAETGASTLLIDCDLRKPIIHKYLQISNSNAGLTSVLSGGASLKDSLVRVQALGIDVLVAGPIPPNPAEILGSSTMNDLVEALAQRYQYIIFDTPPVSVVTDAAVLGRIADGVILVVRQKYVPIESAKLAKSRLQTAGVNIIGAVLNDFDVKNSARDTGYYYTYDYEYKK